MNIKKLICGGLLAGGQATRMGRVNKGAKFAGKYTLATYAINCLRKQVNNIVISANEYLPYYESFGYPVYPDKRPDHQGPLAGIETLLSHCPTDWIFCAPVDVPVYPQNTAINLYQAAIEACTPCAFPVTPLKEQPLVCLVHKSLLTNLGEFLDESNRRVLKWLETNGACKVPFEVNQWDFVNINTNEDLEKFSRFITKQDEAEFKNP